MKRPYLRVTPSSESLNPGDVPDTLASLHKLTRSDSEPLLSRVNPFDSKPPLRFEFVVISPGADEPADFYYGADDHLDVFEQRLRSMYTPSHDIDRVEVDLTKRLLCPVAFPPAEFAERVADGRLYRDPMADTVGEGAAVSDGGEVAIPDDHSVSKNGPPESDGTSEDPNTQIRLDGVDIAPPGSIDEDNPVPAIEQPTETEDGRILARPPLAEVEPYGVQWWGAATRRKDWMTTLTGYIDLSDSDGRPSEDSSSHARRPLVQLVEQLVEAPLPLAFQVVFQRKPDWSRDARRRTGELLDGTDTLIHKILGFESQGSKRSTSGRTTTRHAATRRSPSVGPSDSMGVEQSSRFDQIQANSPKRTFTANVRLLALPTGDVDREDLERRLDALCSVFDLIDGRYYEIEGRRFRSQGVLPRTGERHAQSAVDRFRKRSITTGRKRPTITNRSETRPDLVLNGNELANFVTIPLATYLPIEETQGDDFGQTERDESSTGAQESKDHPSAPGHVSIDAPPEEDPFPNVPESVIHREAEVNQLTRALRPLTGEGSGDTVIITGPTGSGKTCTAKFAVDQFRQKNASVRPVYVNCWENHSPFQVLYRTLDAIDSTVDIHRQSTPRDVLLDRLRDYDRQSCVIVLDEVDQLDDKGVLYELLDLPQYSLILIVNHEEELLGGIDERLESRLRGSHRIRFDRYTPGELVDLLRQQLPDQFDSEDFGRSELELLAEAADGDARVAITALRIAARNGDEGSENLITQDDLESALPAARREVGRENLDDLSSHQRTVFDVIEDFGRIAPKELYAEYRSRVDDPKSNRTVRNYLTKLERHGLVEAEGSTRNRFYRSNV